MRHAICLLLSACFVLIDSRANAADAPLDLRSAVVLAPDSLESRQKKAVEMFCDEIESRTQIRPGFAHNLGETDTPVFIIGDAKTLAGLAQAQHIALPAAKPAEGYSLVSDAKSVWVIGNDSRGV